MDTRPAIAPLIFAYTLTTLAFQLLGIGSLPVRAEQADSPPVISGPASQAIILVQKEGWAEKAKSFAGEVKKPVRLDVRAGKEATVSVYNSSGNEKFDELARAALQEAVKSINMPASYFLLSADGSVVQDEFKEVDYGTYMQDVQKSIKEHWYPPKQAQPLRTVLFFYIQADGSIKSLHIQRSSGVEACDAAALQAVERCTSFPPLPANAPDQIQIEFSLDYNMLSARKETLTPAEQIDKLWKGAIEGEIAKLKQEVK